MIVDRATVVAHQYLIHVCAVDVFVEEGAGGVPFLNQIPRIVGQVGDGAVDAPGDTTVAGVVGEGGNRHAVAADG